MQPIYRATVYARDGATPLTPVAGAAHSDAFRVASAPGVAGFQPYLDTIRGRRGRLDPKTHRTDTGELGLRLLDRRTTPGGSNLERWVTAFIGDEAGRPLTPGLKVFIEESTDGGATWTPFFTGRIQDTRLASRLWFELVVREMSEELNVEVFVGRPHASIDYAVRAPLLPDGLVFPYADLPVLGPLAGKIRRRTQAGAGTFWRVEFDRSKIPAHANIMADALWREAWAVGAGERTRETVRVRVRRTDTGAEGAFLLAPVLGERVATPWGYGSPLLDGDRDDRGHFRVTAVGIAEEDPTAPYYLALPPEGTAVTCWIEPIGPVTPHAPLLIGDVHPVRLWADLLDGKFGRLTPEGQPVRSFPRDTTTFDALIADPSIPVGRFVVEKTAKLNDWVEKHICQAYGLAWKQDALGRIVPIDLRLPAVLPAVPTVTDADLVEDEAPTWDHSRSSAITVAEAVYRIDRQLERKAALYEANEKIPAVPPVLIESRDIPYIDASGLANAGAYGEAKHTIDALGYRATETEHYQGQKRVEWLRRQLGELLDEVRGPFGYGAQTARLTCRRTPNTIGCWQGDWRVVDVALPDPATNRRGGARLMRCLERSEEGPKIVLVFLDAGPDAVALVPTLGAPTRLAGEERHTIVVPVTLNAAGESAELWYAITDTATAVRPAPADPAWTRASLRKASGNATIIRLPSGSRVWLRARSLPTETSSPKLPSLWAYPGGAGYVDTQAIPAPGVPVVTPTGQGYRITWANTDTTSRIMPTLDGVDHRSSPLPSGSTYYVFEGVPPGQHSLGVRYVDSWGGRSPIAAAAAGTAAPLVLAEPRAIWVRQGRTAQSRASLVPEAEATEFGIEIGIAPSEATAGLRVQLATDLAFTAVVIDEILPAGTETARLATVLDDAERYIRAQHVRDGYTASEWSSVVSARPTALRAGAAVVDHYASGYATLTRAADGTVRLAISTSDRDTDRIYYRYTKNPPPDWQPAVTKADVEVPRSDLVDGAITIELGQALVSDALAVAVGFFNDIAGFGQLAHDRIGGTPAALPTAAIDAASGGEDVHRVTYKGALAPGAGGPLQWRRRSAFDRPSPIWTAWGPGPGEGWSEIALPYTQDFGVPAKYGLRVELQVRGADGQVAEAARTLPASLPAISDAGSVRKDYPLDSGEYVEDEKGARRKAAEGAGQAAGGLVGEEEALRGRGGLPTSPFRVEEVRDASGTEPLWNPKTRNIGVAVKAPGGTLLVDTEEGGNRARSGLAADGKVAKDVPRARAAAELPAVSPSSGLIRDTQPVDGRPGVYPVATDDAVASLADGAAVTSNAANGAAAKSRIDTEVGAGTLESTSGAQAKATAAQAAAEAYALAQAQAAQTAAQAYADGEVSAAEARAIAAAEAEAEAARIAAEAYADGIVDAEEARAIADAQAKADAAQAAAERYGRRKAAAGAGVAAGGLVGEEEVLRGRGGTADAGFRTEPFRDSSGTITLVNPVSRRMEGLLLPGGTTATDAEDGVGRARSGLAANGKVALDVPRARAAAELPAVSPTSGLVRDTQPVDGRPGAYPVATDDAVAVLADGATVTDGSARARAGLSAAGDVARDVPRARAAANLPALDVASGRLDDTEPVADGSHFPMVDGDDMALLSGRTADAISESATRKWAAASGATRDGLPSISFASSDDGETGTFWFEAVAQGGVAISTVQVQVQNAAGAWGTATAPTRSAGGASTVKGGTLAANQYEADVTLAQRRILGVRGLVTLDNGVQVPVGPVFFPPNKIPEFLWHTKTGQELDFGGDLETRSWKVQRIDGGGTWVWQADGNGGVVDLTQDDQSTPTANGGIGTGETWTVRVTLYSDSIADQDASTYTSQWDVSVDGPGGGGGGATWVTVSIAPPSIGSANATISLQASAASGTAKVYASVDGGRTWTEITASLAPALSTPPATLTAYSYATGYTRASKGAYPVVDYSIRADILSGATVVATQTATTSWYYVP